MKLADMEARVSGNSLRISRLLVAGVWLFWTCSALVGGPVVLDKLQFNGLEHFQPEKVALAAGLKPGQPITPEGLKAAAEFLGRSGFFSSVRYSYATSGGRMAVTFELSEAGPLRPCAFDNFVGIPESDLQEALKAKLPIYSGELPLHGTAVDEAVEALEELLEKRGITADVSSTDFTDTTSGRTVILFEISSEVYEIRSLEFPGAEKVKPAVLIQASQQLIGRRFSRTAAASFFRLSLLPIYRERGYLRASFGSAVAEPSPTPGQTGVVLRVPVTEGSRYTWGGVSWEGNRLYTSSELDKLLDMKQGDVANGLRFDEGMQRIRDAYGRQGRLGLQVSAQAEYARKEATVTYSVALTEGPVFHMGRLSFQGVPPGDEARLTQAWSLEPGEVYDSSYLETYLDWLTRGGLHRPGKVNIGTVVKPDPLKLTVDITIELK